MYHRSLLGLSVLLLSASCVPPQMLALAAPPAAAPAPAAEPHDRITGKPSIPPLLRAPTTVADAAAFIDATASPTPPPASALPDMLPDPSQPGAPPIRPTSYPPLPAPIAAAPFQLHAQDDESADRALDCLTAAIYYEARSEPVDGQRAVAQVVLNRVRSPAFPNSVCGVVYQGSNRSTGCQFTFTCDGSLLMRRQPAAWARSRAIAQAALAGDVYEPIGSATFYHADYVSPWWAPSLTRVAQIGAHIFYRWPGAMGSSAAFSQHYAGIEPDQSSATAAAGTFSAPGAPVSQYAVDGGTVTVHRGAAGRTEQTSAVAVVAGVRVHSGLAPALESSAPPLPAEEPAAPDAPADSANPAA
jgi:hypothetical protein